MRNFIQSVNVGVSTIELRKLMVDFDGLMVQSLPALRIHFIIMQPSYIIHSLVLLKYSEHP